MIHQQVGLLLALAGGLLMLVGLVVWAGGLGWFGQLPGDIRIQSGTTRIYIPIASMLVVSVALSVLLWLAHRLL